MQKVSVIIPTFKRSDRLRNAIKSVVNQTYKNLEILVVNDDTEETSVLSVIEEFNDSRIMYLRNQRKKGGNGARNTGILNSIGFYIAFLDDDDTWEEDKLLILTNLLEKETTQNKSIISGYKLVDKVQNTNNDICYNFKKIKLQDFLLNKVSLGFSSNIVMTKSLIDMVGLWNEQLQRYQDWEYAVRLLSVTEINYCSKILVNINGHNEPTVSEKIIVYHEAFLNVIDEYILNQEKGIKKHFYALQYRNTALSLLRGNDFNNAFKYLLLSLRYKILIRKHFRFFLVFLTKIFGYNFEKFIGYK